MFLYQAMFKQKKIKTNTYGIKQTNKQTECRHTDIQTHRQTVTGTHVLVLYNINMYLQSISYLSFLMEYYYASACTITTARRI